ncbi:MerR family transcriptional regulator [Streptomyces sp. NPDC014882]|uniref:MerR family transcriptional regulator n=1 Tax=Streptomyces sp. NPDC014882 TaxID=3364927 RepID=UPI0036FE5A82
MGPDARAAAKASDAGITTGCLARRLGVSPTTLRSWDRRYGLGPAVRDEGRHRRWTPEDVATVQEMCRLTASGVPPAEAARIARQRPSTAAAPRSGLHAAPAADPRREPERTAAVPSPPPPHAGSGTSSEHPRQACVGLARAAVRLDAAAVQERLADAVSTHGVVGAWEKVMVPSLRAVGRRWESSGDRYIEVEHLLSWHVSTTLRHVYVTSTLRHAPHAAPPVLLACLPGEQHTLPVEALSAALAERGVPALVLGAAVPTETVVAAVQRVGPAAVVLWSQSRSTASLPLARHIAATRWGVRGARTQSLVMLCGPGWSRPAEPGLTCPAGLGAAVRMLTPAGSA